MTTSEKHRSIRSARGVLSAAGVFLLLCQTSGLVLADSGRIPIEAPWSGTLPVGVPFTVRGVNNVPDLHGDPSDPQLTLFVAGNQFMVMPDLVRAFKALHPEIGRIFYETLPPGILAKQMEKGAITIGNLNVTVKPDIYESGAGRMNLEAKKDRIVPGTIVPYAENDLGIMVAKSNPKHIRGLSDLARPGVRLSMPNPAWEGIATQIQKALRKAGGNPLVIAVYAKKRKSGETVLTRIHHRQTAYRILRHQSDAGVTWISEILFQQKIRHAIGLVPIPKRVNSRAVYAAGMVRDAPHTQAAKAWLAFLRTHRAAAIYRKFGFGPPSPQSVRMTDGKP